MTLYMRKDIFNMLVIYYKAPFRHALHEEIYILASKSE